MMKMNGVLNVGTLLSPYKRMKRKRKERTMENKPQEGALQLDPKDQKEGYVPFIVNKGTHRILMYIQEGMPLFAAYDAALDITVHIREVYRAHVQKAINDQQQADAQRVEQAERVISHVSQ